MTEELPPPPTVPSSGWSASPTSPRPAGQFGYFEAAPLPRHPRPTKHADTRVDRPSPQVVAPVLAAKPVTVPTPTSTDRASAPPSRFGTVALAVATAISIVFIALAVWIGTGHRIPGDPRPEPHPTSDVKGRVAPQRG